jgi:hypothetical protein
MELQVHNADATQIAEVISDDIIIATVDDALDLIGNLGYQGFERAILHAKNIAPEFFDLRTRLAGEILQKFTTYRLRVCIVGDFANVESKSLRDFIYESNKGTQVNFAGTTDEGLNLLAKK